MHLPNQLATRDQDRRVHQRSRIDRLIQLAGHLPDADRLLIEQIYRHGLPVSEVAKLTGVPARQLHRRIGRLLKRINQPLFRFVIAHSDLLPASTRAIARDVVIRGLSLRRAARANDTTLHRVRMHMQTTEILAGIFHGRRR